MFCAFHALPLRSNGPLVSAHSKARIKRLWRHFAESIHFDSVISASQSFINFTWLVECEYLSIFSPLLKKYLNIKHGYERVLRQIYSSCIAEKNASKLLKGDF